MARVSRCGQPPIILTLCFLLAVRAEERNGVVDGSLYAKIEQQVVRSTSPVEELRQAIDELKTLIRAADDIQDSIRKATVRHASFLRRAQLELTKFANACPSGQCKEQQKRKRPPPPSKADMWKRPLFALCLGLIGYWQFTRLRGRRRAAAMDAAHGDRDALEHDAALAAFGQERGRIPGEDAEYAAELRDALREEERHLSSDHFRESLLEDKWRPKRHAPGMDTSEGHQQALLRRRMAMPPPQQAVPSWQDPAGRAAIPRGPSSGPAQLASSLARLQQLEDSELSRPGPNMRQLPQQSPSFDAAAGDSQEGVFGSTSGILQTPAVSANDDLQRAGHGLTSKAEHTLPPALQRRAAELGDRSMSRDSMYSSAPEGRIRRTSASTRGPSLPYASTLEPPHPGRGGHMDRQVSESMQNTLAANLPKLGTEVIGQPPDKPQ